MPEKNMTVRMRTAMAGTGPDGEDVSFRRGEEVEIKASWAKSLIEGGQAEPVARKQADRSEKRG